MKRKRISVWLLCLLTALLLAAGAKLPAEGSDAEAAGSGWVLDGGGWWYRNADGSYPYSAWQQINGSWYYFTASGYMDYGEYRDGYWLGADGAWNPVYSGGHWVLDSIGWWYTDNTGWYPAGQWLWINGACYYFDAAGYMAADTWIGNWHVNASGAWDATWTLQQSTWHGALGVRGTSLTDSAGNPVQLKGISTFGLVWDEGKYNINYDAFRTLRDNWGVNTIRLAMYTQEYGGYLSGGDRTAIENTIDTAVKDCWNLGMYCIIDWHILSDGNPNAHLWEAEDFFSRMSAKYAGYDNVLYEICNEPNGGVSWQEIRSYADQVIPYIRANDSDAVILVGTPNWSQDVDQVAAAPVAYPENVMYVVHFYASTHKDDIRAKVQRALAAGTPVFISEFSICAADGSGSIDYASAEAWKQLIQANNISYIGWSLSNKNETSAILQPWCQKHSGWNYDDLSDTGKWLMHMISGQ